LANHKSAEKRARSSARRNAINAKTMSSVRTLEKKVRKTITAKEKDEAGKALTAFASKIQKAAQKGRIPRRTASRKISRLSKAVSAIA
jgi:small subunit ribosomal protein S20